MFDGDLLLQCISDSGFLSCISLFKVFLLGLNWLDVLDFYKTLTFKFIFSWFCMFFVFVFVLRGERHKREVKIHIYLFF